MSGRRIALAAFFCASIVVGTRLPALANHGNEVCTDAYKQEMGVSESVNFSVMGKAAVKVDQRVIAPVPLKDMIVRSVYLFKTVDDLVELGYEHPEGSFPLMFSVKVYNGHYSDSYGGWPGSPNPGAGPLGENSNHTLQVWRNPQGNDANRVEMRRDGLYFGFYNHDRIANAAVLSGSEGWSKCDDMQNHVWNMKAKTSPSGSWVNWSAVRVAQELGPTKWWYNQRAQSPPEWWVNHCSSANCPDV